MFRLVYDNNIKEILDDNEKLSSMLKANALRFGAVEIEEPTSYYVTDVTFINNMRLILELHRFLNNTTMTNGRVNFGDVLIVDSIMFDRYAYNHGYYTFENFKAIIRKKLEETFDKEFANRATVSNLCRYNTSAEVFGAMLRNIDEDFVNDMNDLQNDHNVHGTKFIPTLYFSTVSYYDNGVDVVDNEIKNVNVLTVGTPIFETNIVNPHRLDVEKMLVKKHEELTGQLDQHFVPPYLGIDFTKIMDSEYISTNVKNNIGEMISDQSNNTGVNIVYISADMSIPEEGKHPFRVHFLFFTRNLEPLTSIEKSIAMNQLF